MIQIVNVKIEIRFHIRETACTPGRNIQHYAQKEYETSHSKRTLYVIYPIKEKSNKPAHTRSLVWHQQYLTRIRSTVELQWLDHRWLVYRGYFELVLVSLGKNPIAADMIIFEII